ncbi:alpha-L-fucosidase [Humibacter sp.]|uniref:alpha-L-fucosidase n=1 Tax=Humibacter sp. TaxID=1940291 RepID=UPI003F810E9B
MHDRFARSEWFRHDRFGLFIHWGAYAVPARGEWARSFERISVEDYQRHVDAFQPDSFDPGAWADAAVAAGMKYAVLTAKHHDGFCLFDSKLTDYSTMHNGLGRDVVAEFLDAFRSRGLKVGLYYSLLDWHHPDYPAYGDAYHPMRDEVAWKDRTHDFDRYLEYLHGQVRELCTRYGQLDILWFDFSYDDLTAEKWRATELVDMVRELQPNVIVDNRLEASGAQKGSIVTDAPTPFSGDFASPEQIIPTEGVRTESGEPVPWEACITLNNHWGYNAFDMLWKPSELVVRKLVECVSKGGNLLLNVGPDAHGRFPQPAVDILREVGAWLRDNGESVYGAGASTLPKPEWGRYTQHGDTVYAHVLEAPVGPLALTPLRPDQVADIRLVADGTDLPLAGGWHSPELNENALVAFGPDQTSTYPLPDPVDTVLAVRLSGR